MHVHTVLADDQEVNIVNTSSALQDRAQNKVLISDLQ